jgi:hypothetical protein
MHIFRDNLMNVTFYGWSNGLGEYGLDLDSGHQVRRTTITSRPGHVWKVPYRWTISYSSCKEGPLKDPAPKCASKKWRVIRQPRHLSVTALLKREPKPYFYHFPTDSLKRELQVAHKVKIGPRVLSVKRPTHTQRQSNR